MGRAGAPAGPLALAAALATTLAPLPGAAQDAVRPAMVEAGAAATQRRGGGTAVREAPADTLGLEEALRTALGGNPELSRVRARASAEHAARWADWGAFLPTASASASLSRARSETNTFLSPEGVPQEADSTIVSVSKSASQRLSFSWNLLEGGRRFTEMSAGAADVRAAELQVSETERRVVSEVKQAYFDALRQQRLVEIARRQLDNRRRELEQTRRRYRIAAVGREDLLGAQLEVRQAEVTLLEAEDRAEAALRALRVATGAPAGGDGPVPADVALREAPPPPDPSGLEAAELVGRAVESHPELRRLEAEIDAAASRVWSGRSRYLPTITLSYSHSRSELGGAGADFFRLNPRDRSNGFSISAQWELFQGFQRREENARASASLDQARADRALRRLEVERTVRDLVDEVKRRARKVDLLEEQLRVARERLELIQEQFRLGSAGFDVVQRAIEEVTSAEQAVVGERYDYLSAWARLERWAGDVAESLPDPAAGEGGE